MLDVPIDKIQNEILYTCYSRSCKDITDKHQLLFCVTCRRGFHCKCCDPPLKYNYVNYYEWQCHRCKVCSKCYVHEDDEIIVICDCCDRAYHLGCTLEKYNEIPSGKWYCDDCSICIVCTTRLTPKEAINQRFSYEGSNVIICSNCAKIYYRDGSLKLKICDCCNLVILSNFKCRFCRSDTHIECANGNGVCRNCESLGNGYQDPDEA